MTAVSTEEPVRSAQRQPEGVAALASGAHDRDGSLEAGFDAPIRFRVQGDPEAPPVAVLGGISADRICNRWWHPVVGPEGALDPDRHRLISIDWMTGGSGVGTREHARALSAVLDHLQVDRLAALVGASYGAMVGLAFAAEYQARVGRLIAISGAHRSTPAATARRLVQREIVRFAIREGRADRGVALARALALTTYRPADVFDRRFYDENPDSVVSALASYLDYNGHVFAQACGAERYLALSESLDRHRVDVDAIKCPVDLVGMPSDDLVPLDQLRQLAGMVGFRCRLHVVDSPYGHDAFLKSPELINPLLERLLDNCREAVDEIA